MVSASILVRQAALAVYVNVKYKYLVLLLVTHSQGHRRDIGSVLTGSPLAEADRQ
jgi:hypothetical protein